ncbi:cytochrome c oxidase subunit 3 [Ammoniphilus resinae]|uniref:Cytochrome c oxidase subunit 3 n=1 Tax=Ammoniphilus resinae TaxID=861532 RepID=A0ABS4GWP9_9BACL|nr:cytochrome c oxidase subunit 3 [Ammoniphilus resinae]MBP1934694.1 cytochrome c oxidase subunit 3 [Ammoniphilus resinae]
MSTLDFKANGLPAHPEKATQEGRAKLVGFWLYMSAEAVLFATFFGTFMTFRNSVNGGPTGAELFAIPMVFTATAILLVSSLTSVFAIMAMQRNLASKMRFWFAVTVLLGASFLGLEVYEFVEYVHEGHTFTSSPFGSSFYTLVGFHGAHVLFGVLWISTLLLRNINRPIDTYVAPKYYVASLYWHFVDLVWVFIFTIVYLFGMVG